MAQSPIGQPGSAAAIGRSDTNPFTVPLPVDDVLEQLTDALATSGSAVLVAPPGAGKTTRVPLALLNTPWLGDRKIIVLEPRRIAARGAAERMAQSLGEKVGQTVGLRARLNSRVGPDNRIEVVTEGVFTRMILDDPTLEGIGAVLFDEFHERSLDADLGLALTLDARQALRPDLRIAVMSATLAADRVSDLLGGAPVIVSEGRSFPVETRYLGRNPNRSIEDQMVAAIVRAMRAEPGSLLAFLPGQGEIRRVAEALEDEFRGSDVLIAPLYGAMDPREQDRAIAPAPSGQRKIVLATSIAETSLTIEGIRIVVDSGLARVPRFEANVGITRLATVRAPLSSADQRRGRAGRLEPGVCYRLWDEAQTASLARFPEPEIRTADLTGLLLDCAEWGVVDPAALSWLDQPPPAAIDAAREQLIKLNALDASGHLTSTGRMLRTLPLPPRLARMVLAAAELGCEQQAAEIAAVIVERGIGGNDTDLAVRLERFQSGSSRRDREMRRLAGEWARAARSQFPDAQAAGPGREVGIAEHLPRAYPDRIAKSRGGDGQYLLANGRGARLDAAEPLARSSYLVIADMQGSAAATRILLAAQASEEEIEATAATRAVSAVELSFDAETASVRGLQVRRLGAISLSSRQLQIESSDETQRLLAEGVAKLGIGRLPWSKAQKQLRSRVAFLRAAAGPDEWPDLSDTALAATVADWLAPFLAGKLRLSEIGADDLSHALDHLLSWQQRQRLDDEAPTHFLAPTGNSHPIDYESPGAPALHIRVQELFGLTTHPAIGNGRLPLTLHLLSPAHRPIQITRDLPGFWAGSWSAVKAEMKGRYPKHVWPDDPARAQATRRAKPRKGA